MDTLDLAPAGGFFAGKLHRVGSDSVAYYYG
jgi:hypothetical protein